VAKPSSTSDWIRWSPVMSAIGVGSLVLLIRKLTAGPHELTIRHAYPKVEPGAATHYLPD
jgi:hypothetical protein